MKKILLLPLLGALSIFSACNKQSDADRQAEIDRQVQQKLDAEHQAQQRDDLARREGELNAREQALAQRESTPNESDDSQDRQVRGGQAPSGGGDYGLFYSKLEPHGDWIETSQYGYVFSPREAQSSSWRPYTDGRWVYSDAGWTWVSEEPFGWATYHYGRWTRLRSVGWVWIPGDEWAPAWVSWRKSDNYVGWAPLPPEARFERDTGIHNWADNYYDIGPENYCFIETREFGAPRIARAIVPAQQNVTIVNQTTNVTNITYNNTMIVNQGPSYDEIRVRSAQPVQRVKLERDVNISVNVGEPHSVVRADTVVIPAPVIQRTRVVEKPKVVKKTITNVVVERGWDDVKDRQAAEQARAKIRGEATPPPNAPPKQFVRPQQVSAATPMQRSTLSAATPSPNESASVAPTRATSFHAPSPAATAVPSATATPVESATPPRPRINPNRKPFATPSPNASLSAPPEAIVTPANSLGTTPSPAVNDAAQRRNRLRDQRQNNLPNHETRRERRVMAGESPTESPIASPNASESPTSSGPTRREDRQEHMRERRQGQRGLTNPAASPSATATPTPAGM